MFYNKQAYIYIYMLRKLNANRCIRRLFERGGGGGSGEQKIIPGMKILKRLYFKGNNYKYMCSMKKMS